MKDPNQDIAIIELARVLTDKNIGSETEPRVINNTVPETGDATLHWTEGELPTSGMPDGSYLVAVSRPNSYYMVIEVMGGVHSYTGVVRYTKLKTLVQ